MSRRTLLIAGVAAAAAVALAALLPALGEAEQGSEVMLVCAPPERYLGAPAYTAAQLCVGSEPTGSCPADVRRALPSCDVVRFTFSGVDGGPVWPPPD